NSNTQNNFLKQLVYFCLFSFPVCHIVELKDQFCMFEPNIFSFHTCNLNKKRGVNVCLHRGI
ncbi:hypothetical protein LDENG_00214920, partial [Lucifuga dentata]